MASKSELILTIMPASYQNITSGELVDRLQRVTTVSPADIMAVLYSLTELAAEFADNGVMFPFDKNNIAVSVKTSDDEVGETHYILCLDILPGPRLEKIMSRRRPGDANAGKT